MRKLTHSLPAKITAVFLFVIVSTVALCAGFGIGYLVNCGYYQSESFLDSEQCQRLSNMYAAQVFEYLDTQVNSGEESQYYHAFLEERLLRGGTNYCFYITDESGQIVLKNFEGDVEQGRDYGSYTAKDGANYYQRGFVREITVKDDYYESYQTYLRLAPHKYSLIIWVGVLALVAAALLIFLFCAAGHRGDREGVALNWQDKIPLDLFAALVFFAGLALFGLTVNVISYNTNSLVQMLLGVAPLYLGWLLLALDTSMSLAARFKAGKWWRNSILYRIGHFIAQQVRMAFRYMKFTWKAALAFLGYLVLNFVLTVLCFDAPGFILVILALNFWVLLLLCRYTAQLGAIFQGGKRIADGELNYKIQADKMNQNFREHAETLNNIGGGMSLAVEERMRSERMKTELITNVSHDIKTPLTSIVNYVDLLKKERMPSKSAEEYLGVLERQSQRLKKLTEDLVEASKASTGNLQVELVLTDFAELCRQAAGEYIDRLEERKLELVANLAEEAYIYADGRHLFRVLDNLFGNICKYAQPGTRVYLDLALEEKSAVLSLKNISQDRLNISPGELMERFVRGDSARSTEGSGLGLSIARSLTELQGGTFDVEIDGDLFKAQVSFPAASLL